MEICYNYQFNFFCMSWLLLLLSVYHQLFRSLDKYDFALFISYVICDSVLESHTPTCLWVHLKPLWFWVTYFIKKTTLYSSISLGMLKQGRYSFTTFQHSSHSVWCQYETDPSLPWWLDPNTLDPHTVGHG